MSILDNRVVAGDMDSATAAGVEKMLEYVRQTHRDAAACSPDAPRPRRVDIGELHFGNDDEGLHR